MPLTTVYCTGKTYDAKENIKAIAYGELGDAAQHLGAEQKVFRWNTIKPGCWAARVPDELIDPLCNLVSERCPGVGVECDVSHDEPRDEPEAPW